MAVPTAAAEEMAAEEGSKGVVVAVEVPVASEEERAAEEAKAGTLVDAVAVEKTAAPLAATVPTVAGSTAADATEAVVVAAATEAQLAAETRASFPPQNTYYPAPPRLHDIISRRHPVIDAPGLRVIASCSRNQDHPCCLSSTPQRHRVHDRAA